MDPLSGQLCHRRARHGPEQVLRAGLPGALCSGDILWTAFRAGLTGWKELETPHLRLRYRASDEIIRAGNHMALRLEVSLKPKMHVYALGVAGNYIPVQWQMVEGAWKASPPQCRHQRISG